MRTRFHTFLLSAAFALAAASQASAAFDADYFPAMIEQPAASVVAESITTDPVLEVLSGAALVTVNAPADDADVEGAATLAAAEVVIPLPEDVSPLVASELAALAEPVTEAVAAVVAAVIEVTTDPIETTGSLPATPISHADTSEPLDLETSIIE